MASEWFTREILTMRGNLFGFILSMVRNFDLAEELYQEVTIRMLERESDFTKGTNFGAWARAFARRTVLEEQRRRGKLRLSQEAVEAVEEEMQGVEKGHMARREALQHCMQKLDVKARKLIDLRYKEGMSMKDIGPRMSRSGPAAQVALSRIRVLLSRCIRRRIEVVL